MPGRQAPSEGTKVTMGNQAPVYQEGSGAVQPDSLAAESQAFQSNNRTSEGVSASQPQEGYSSTNQSSSISSGDTGLKSGSAASAGTAPGYVGNLSNQDPSGPHGKNLKEDPNLEGKNNSGEFGTANDPGRLAEQKFTLGANTPAVAHGGGQEKLNKESPYDALSSSKEA
ncbi:hypothetical protein PG993_008913 [Apiospora rasikravindrae]|uniref:Uncharacterized protein n=1 Tax=Apiospora rasikravindrae TaxID=990691 RepID=A0ABR1SPP0_9PEZI